MTDCGDVHVKMPWELCSDCISRFVGERILLIIICPTPRLIVARIRKGRIVSTEPGETFWEPSVSVVGVDRRGSGIVDSIDTATAANIQTISSEGEAVSVADGVSDYDFCFLTGDLCEATVPDWVSTVLSSSESRTICLLSGTTDRPSELLDDR
ncbi:hypothetical protein [Salinigranum halophilum]|uniref:hypothetical protein n=1 Tax=Salinigranum halophilum TaxID=2565931 RepID=UPI00115EECC2|nr:hypothetical protein [Salinigranum halophilum]